MPAIALGDTVYAEYNESKEMLTFIERVQASGHSIIWAVIKAASIDIDKVRDLPNQLDCTLEAMSERYFTMNVQAQTNYLHVKDKLNELKQEGILEYAEPCLSEQHPY